MHLSAGCDESRGLWHRSTIELATDFGRMSQQELGAQYSGMRQELFSSTKAERNVLGDMDYFLVLIKGQSGHI